MRANVVCLFSSESYYPLAYVLARELARVPARSYDVIIYTDRADRPAPEGVAALAFPYAAEVAKGAPASDRIPHAAYYRLFMADVLPAQYRRAVYLDCDITVTPQFERLFSIDLNGNAIAAVADCGHVHFRSPEQKAARQAYLKSIHIDPARVYFNAGVQVADLDQWRRLNVSSRTMAFLREHRDIVTGMDQDALNYTLGDAALELSPKWNFQALYFDFGLEEIFEPAVYHHLDMIKPWHDLVYKPNAHSDAYARMFAESPYPDFIRRAREPRHRKYAVKWAIRRGLRVLPPVKRRFDFERAKLETRRDLVLGEVAAKLAANAYADIDAAESVRLAGRVRALRAAGVP